MRITFIGAAHEVTGSCSLLEVCGKNIIVDCGMEQGIDLFENIEIPIAPSDIDAIVVTHAHIDHTGKLPFLVANGYSGPVYSTEATRQLCDIMLKDSAHIQEMEAQWRNRKGKRADEGGEHVPLYTMDDVLRTMPLFKTAGYGTDVELFDGIKIRYTDAGHLLGSASVLFTIQEDGVERTILFSGDLGNIEKPLIRSPQDPPHADYVVCESTYGDRTHPEAPDYVAQLTRIIQTTLDRGGNVVVPAFAVGRTQELLYYIRIIKEEGLVKGHDGFPVVVDSPLAVEATNIYSTEMYEYYDEEAIELLRAGINPVTFPDLKISVSTDESKAINGISECRDRRSQAACRRLRCKALRRRYSGKGRDPQDRLVQQPCRHAASPRVDKKGKTGHAHIHQSRRGQGYRKLCRISLHGYRQACDSSVQRRGLGSCG